MRIALAALMLAGCATIEPEAPAAPPEDGCGAGRVADLVGRARRDVLDELARRSGARRIRWIRPGDAVTMDYSPARLNVYFDARDRVERVTCG